LVHVSAPKVEYLPGLQLLQLQLPNTLLYVPALHCIHVSEPNPEYLPFAQLVQLADPCEEYFPHAQLLHEVLPA
jgi:hypothetical protein